LEKEELKKLAGEKATEYIEDGMIIGLGTGSSFYNDSPRLVILI
jgi:ribose 5-phosphate isomerase A